MKLLDKLPGVGELIGKVDIADIVGGLPGIALRLLGPGSAKTKLLTEVRERTDDQEARTAGKELGFASHKFLSEVARNAPADKREEMVDLAARALMAQHLDAAEELKRFAQLALQREATRGKGDAAEKAALEAREAGERRMLEQYIDIGRVANGDAPKMGAVA